MTEKTLDLFGDEIKHGDLIIVTAFQGRNPETMVGRVTNVSQKTSMHSWNDKPYTSHTVSFFKIDNPKLYSAFGQKECGRIVKSGNPDRIVIANDHPKTVEFVEQFEDACHDIQIEKQSEKEAYKQKKAEEKRKEKELETKRKERAATKAAKKKAVLAKLTKEERKALGV